MSVFNDQGIFIMLRKFWIGFGDKRAKLLKKAVYGYIIFQRISLKGTRCLNYNKSFPGDRKAEISIVGLSSDYAL